MLLQVIDQSNKKIRDMDMAVWLGERLNQDLLYYTVKAQRNNGRHGTVKVKTRAEVNRTNKKVYKQKGTGNARHGSQKVDIYVGGGNVHGPQSRSYFEKLNKKAKHRSYQELFKYLIQNGQLKVVDDLNFDRPSTKVAANFLKSVGVGKALVYLPKGNVCAQRSFRNICNIKVAHEENLCVYDMLKSENVIMTASFLGQLKERYSL